MKWSRMAAVVCGLGMLFIFAGCSEKITPWSVRTSMSPELTTIARKPGQRTNAFFRTADTNLRYAQDDFYRVMMLDEPNKIGTLPIP